jgi:hypothetical protein
MGALVVFALVVACSTRPVETAVLQSPGDTAVPLKNVVVFAGRVPPAERKVLEDECVTAFAKYGVRAAPSYSLFPVGRVHDDQAAIRAFLQQGGYDGALVTTLTDASAPVLVAPGMDWAGGFGHSYLGSRPPDGADSELPVWTFETTLWSPATGKMVWSTFTEAKNPRSGTDFASRLVSTIVSTLARQGLTPSGPGTRVSPVLPVSTLAHDAWTTRSVQ